MTTFADVQAPIDEDALRKRNGRALRLARCVGRLQVRYDPAKLEDRRRLPTRRYTASFATMATFLPDCYRSPMSAALIRST